MSDSASRQPILNAPGVVITLLGVLIAIHMTFELLPAMVARDAQIALAFVPARYGGAGAAVAVQLPGGAWAAAASFVTHAFLHGDWIHLTVNSAWLLAFGSALARRVGSSDFLLLFLVSAVGGAVFYLIINFGEPAALVGASGGISGLMGAAFRFIVQPPNGGDDALAPIAAPRLSLGEMARTRQLRLIIGFWIVMNFVVAWGAGGVFSAGGIAWEAHLGGFLVGLLMFPLFDPVPPQFSSPSAPPAPTPPPDA